MSEVAAAGLGARAQLVELPSLAALAEAVALRLAGEVERAVARSGEALLALSGGRTPEPAYRRLGARDLPWDRVRLTLTDERWVAPEDPLSNARMVRRALSAGPGAAARLERLWSDAPDIVAAAAAADARLLARPRPFDAVLLGMGQDGHTASLFPDTPELAQGLDPLTPRRCLAVQPHAPAPAQARLTLTLPEIAGAEAVLLAIAGGAKRATLNAVLAGEDDRALPIGAVFAHARAPVEVFWTAEESP